MTILSKVTLRGPLIRFANHSKFLRKLKDDFRLRSWQKAGCPVPPPHVAKQRMLSAYALAFDVVTFIETGTYRGDMVYAMKDLFKAVISIELSTALWRKATVRFRDCPHINILQGDSGELLPAVLHNISGRCLFWLDGHYSGGTTAKGSSETPVMKEITTICKHVINDHVILIDDARCFDGTHGYPTLRELQRHVELIRPDYAFSVANDVIRVHPDRNVDVNF